MFVQTVMILSLIVFTDWLFCEHMALTFSWEYFHLEHIWIRICDQSNSMILHLCICSGDDFVAQSNELNIFLKWLTYTSFNIFHNQYRGYESFAKTHKYEIKEEFIISGW